ncbi:cyclase [Pseudoalteromonas sp. BSi20495]|nr:cyclase [Pseudoalteromonas sp. BSi20495]
MAKAYSEAGADELVFYEISASVEKRLLDVNWVESIARNIDIPFCVADGIKSVADAARVLERGADKISINSPAIARPDVFKQSKVDGALAASVFHKNVINIGELKQFLTDNQVAARLCK